MNQFYMWPTTHKTPGQDHPVLIGDILSNAHLFRKTINCVTDTAYVTLNAFLLNFM